MADSDAPLPSSGGEEGCLQARHREPSLAAGLIVRQSPPVRMAPMRCVLAAWLAALAAAGCGGRAAPSRPKPEPCSARVAAVAGRADLVARDPDIVTCVYGEAVRVITDSAPQALLRFQRAEVERTQTTAEWARIPDQQPRIVSGVGLGAFWVRGPRELVASDGRRLITVRVLRPSAGARAIAIRVVRAALAEQPAASGR